MFFLLEKFYLLSKQPMSKISDYIDILYDKRKHCIKCLIKIKF